jgi:hypothetical protein
MTEPRDLRALRRIADEAARRQRERRDGPCVVRVVSIVGEVAYVARRGELFGLGFVHEAHVFRSRREAAIAIGRSGGLPFGARAIFEPRAHRDLKPSNVTRIGGRP